MSNSEALKRIEAARVELAAAEEALKEADKPKEGLLWEPEPKQGYWVVTDHAEIFESRGAADSIDNGRHLMGSCYPTKEAAEKARDQRLAEVKVCRRLAELCAEESLPWVADWGNRTQAKHRPQHNGHSIETGNNTFLQIAPPHWYSSHAAWTATLREMEPDVRLMMGV